jgi:hypothetical protein
MKINWRVSAITAGAAFLLSTLVGVLGGVGFGAIMLRALLLGVLFGLGVIGLGLAVNRFLPELGQVLSGETDENDSGGVDIVIDEDSPAELYKAAEEAADASEAGEEAEETASELVAETDDGVISDEDASLVDDDVEEPEELEPAEEADSESLPDMDSFSDSFAGQPRGPETPTGLSTEGPEDPAVMAQAIRTVLKREG